MAIRILSSESISGNITIHSPSNAPYIDFVENADTGDSKARITMNQIDTNNGTLIFATENAGTLTTALTISQSQNATFGGNVTLTTANTDTILTIGTSASGGIDWDIQSASSSSPYAQSAGDLLFRNASSNVLILGNNGSATFAGSVTGTVARFDTLNNNANSANIIYRSGTNTIVGNNASALVVQDGGNVGIGTTSPGATLDVSKDLSSTNNVQLIVRNTNGTAKGAGIGFYDELKNMGYVGINYSAVNWSTGRFTFALTPDGGVTAPVELMSILKSGNVGIGTDSPTEKLHIKSTTSGSFIRFEDNGGSGVYVGSRSDDLEFYAGNSEKMVILSGGNVGIGTTSPDTKLMVSGEILSENSNGGYFVSTRVPSSSSRPTLNFYGSALDINYVTGYAGGGASTAMTILSGGNVGIGVTGPSATLQVESVGGNGGGGDTDYQILAKNSTTSTSQQSTLGAIHPGDGYANLNLGSNVSGLKFWHISKRTSASSHRIEMYYNSGTFVNLYTFETNGTFTATGDIVAYSDKRLKSNIKTLDGSKVLKMRGVSFEKDGKKGSGVIAQELEKVAPELVHNELEYKGVAYGNLVGYLIEAIKELELRVKELENK